MTQSYPLISVIMPHFNGGDYVLKAIKSILEQSYAHLELIIIDDCSTDGSYEILQTLQDPRIILQREKVNSGSGAALHKAMSMAKGKYIACMDADDIAKEHRLEKQILFLEQNLEYAMVGCHYDKIDHDDQKIKSVTIPIDDVAIRYRMIFNYPFCHPSVMYRADILKEHNITYNPTSRFAEDYDVAIQISQHGKLYNLPDNLLYFRKHENSITKKNSTKNKNAKVEFIQKFHPTMLSQDFIKSEHYKFIIDVFFREDISLIKDTPEIFFKTMFLCADSFIEKTGINKKHIIYRETIDLILRYYVIKAKGYKDIKGILSLFKNKYFLKYVPYFIYYQLKRLCPL